MKYKEVEDGLFSDIDLVLKNCFYACVNSNAFSGAYSILCTDIDTEFRWQLNMEIGKAL